MKQHRLAERVAVVGLGVGLYQNYGASQRMYVRRGYVFVAPASSSTDYR